MRKFVKIAKLGSRVQEFFLDNGATVASILAIAGEDSGGYEVRVNGVVVDAETPLDSGDIVTLVPAIKGGN